MAHHDRPTAGYRVTVVVLCLAPFGLYVAAYLALMEVMEMPGYEPHAVYCAPWTDRVLESDAWRAAFAPLHDLDRKARPEVWRQRLKLTERGVELID